MLATALRTSEEKVASPRMASTATWTTSETAHEAEVWIGLERRRRFFFGFGAGFSAPTSASAAWGESSGASAGEEDASGSGLAAQAGKAGALPPGCTCRRSTRVRGREVPWRFVLGRRKAQSFGGCSGLDMGLGGSFFFLLAASAAFIFSTGLT